MMNNMDLFKNILMFLLPLLAKKSNNHLDRACHYSSFRITLQVNIHIIRYCNHLTQDITKHSVSGDSDGIADMDEV